MTRTQSPKRLVALVSLALVAAAFAGCTGDLGGDGNGNGGHHDPVLSVIPSTLSIESDETSATFAIANAGEGTLTWSVAADVAWLGFSPSSGTGDATVTVTADRADLTQGTHTATITVTSNAGNRTVSVSLDVVGDVAAGTIVFHTTRDLDYEVYSVDSDGTDITNLSRNDAADMLPVLSPDGSKIAFMSDRSGAYDVWVMNADGSNPLNLTNHPEQDCPCDWSPDGQRIVFSSERVADEPEIYTMDADGSSPVRLTENDVEDVFADWSPDGQRIAFQRDIGDNDEIYVMNADGTNQVRLTDNAMSDWSPAWSPDGSKIAFCSNRTGDWELYTMNPDGSAVTLVPAPAGVTYRTHPAWSPDGTMLAFQTYPAVGDYGIAISDLAGSFLLRLAPDDMVEGFPDWGP